MCKNSLLHLGYLINEFVSKHAQTSNSSTRLVKHALLPKDDALVGFGPNTKL